jgi:Rrf2 family protein
MLITQKHKYALRAVFELAAQWPTGRLTKLAVIASRQSIPRPFLEVIMARLRRGHLVIAKRGCEGGYGLRTAPAGISVGDVFRALEGARSQQRCLACGDLDACPQQGRCAFMPLWQDVETAVFDVYDRTSIQHLLDNDHQLMSVHQGRVGVQARAAGRLTPEA